MSRFTLLETLRVECAEGAYLQEEDYKLRDMRGIFLLMTFIEYAIGMGDRTWSLFIDHITLIY